MLSLFVNEKDAVEDLHCLMRVHRGAYFGEHIKISIDEFTNPSIIVHSSRS